MLQACWSLWGSCSSWGLLCIHLNLLLHYFHKYTYIYNVIGLLALKEVVVFERGFLFHIHLLLNCVLKYLEIYDGIGMLVLKGAVMFEERCFLYPSPCPEL